VRYCPICSAILAGASARPAQSRAAGGLVVLVAGTDTRQERYVAAGVAFPTDYASDHFDSSGKTVPPRNGLMAGSARSGRRSRYRQRGRLAAGIKSVDDGGDPVTTECPGRRLTGMNRHAVSVDGHASVERRHLVSQAERPGPIEARQARKQGKRGRTYRLEQTIRRNPTPRLSAWPMS
jgi:hypothetical protein